MHARSKGIIATYRGKDNSLAGVTRATGKKRLFEDCYLLDDGPEVTSGATSTPSSQNNSSVSSFGSVASSVSSAPSSVSARPALRERLLFDPFAQPKGGMSSSALPVADDIGVEEEKEREEESQRYNAMNDEELYD